MYSMDVLVQKNLNYKWNSIIFSAQNFCVFFRSATLISLIRPSTSFILLWICYPSSYCWLYYFSNYIRAFFRFKWKKTKWNGICLMVALKDDTQFPFTSSFITTLFQYLLCVIFFLQIHEFSVSNVCLM